MTNQDTFGKAIATQKMMDAIRRILETAGYLHLTGSAIAEKAGVPHMLIFEYFGSVDQLVERYFTRKDYWHPLLYQLETFEIAPRPGFGKDAVIAFFRKMLALLETEPDLQQALHWEMNERHRIVDAVFIGREAAFGKLVALSRPFFQGAGVDFAQVYRLCCQYLFRMILKAYVPAAFEGVPSDGGDTNSAEAYTDRTLDIRSDYGKKFCCAQIDYIIEHLFARAILPSAADAP
ncbi:TetR/AcrR family transcriptional regulator [Chitinophaga lutea]